MSARGDLIVNAIERFEKDQGRAPSSLTELVPKYLDAIPDFEGKPFKYRVVPEDEQETYWMGYSMGSPETAKPALIFIVDGSNRVTEIDTDSIPQPPEEEAFDARTWESERGRRWKMARAAGRMFSAGQSARSEVEAALGKPDFDSPLGRKPPWFLSIDGPYFPQSDVVEIFYSPVQDYRSFLRCRRVGRWAYLYF